MGSPTTKARRRAAAALVAATMPSLVSWGNGGSSQVSADSRSNIGPAQRDAIGRRAHNADGSGEDALFYAEHFGVSAAEAERRLALQPQLLATLASLRDLAGERLAGSWIDNGERYGAVIRLTGAPADRQAFEQLVRKAPAPVEVRYDATVSLAALYAELLRMQPQLRAAFPESSTGLDQETSAIRLYVPRGSNDERAARAGGPAAMQAMTNASVEVLYDDGSPVLLAAYGGGLLSGGCTAGFTVKDNNSDVKGVLTAGHCGPPQTYLGLDGAVHGTAEKTLAHNTHKDLGWYGTTGVELPEFWASSATSRRALHGFAAWADQTVNSVICHRGGTTGYSCGTITDKTFAPEGEGICPGGACEPTRVRFEGADCDFGDSGSPVFFGNTAYGILSGGSVGCGIGFYMPVDFKGELSVSLLFA